MMSDELGHKMLLYIPKNKLAKKIRSNSLNPSNPWTILLAKQSKITKRENYNTPKNGTRNRKKIPFKKQHLEILR